MPEEPFLNMPLPLLTFSGAGALEALEDAVVGGVDVVELLVAMLDVAAGWIAPL